MADSGVGAVLRDGIVAGRGETLNVLARRTPEPGHRVKIYRRRIAP